MVQMLIQDVSFRKILQDSINIDRTANDPIPTFKVVLQDDPSQVQLTELMEVVFIDEQAIANPTHNFLLNPIISPYTSNWTQVTTSGGSFTDLSPGVRFTASNIAASFGLTQNTQNGLVVAGQTYMFSATVATTTLTNCNAYLSLTFLDANGNTLSQQVTVIGSGISATQFTASAQAPTNTITIQVGIGMQQSSGTNSGTASFTQTQLEPTCFTSGSYQITYPTPFCASGQANCFVLPDSTCIRQSRLFGGYITKATAGKYIGNNRQWTISVSGYAWLLGKQLLNNSWTSQTDAFIIGQIVSTYFPKAFSTTLVATGATLDVFGYSYNGTARDAVNLLAQNAGYFFYIDAYREIIYQPPGYNTLGFSLSDQPDNVTSFPYYGYSLDIDGTQIGNATLVTGAANVSAVEYDAQSIGYYNVILNGQGIFWRTVNDSTITSNNVARSRAIAENATYGYARKIAHCSTQQLMIPGYTVIFSSITDGLYDVKFLVQKATISIKGFTSPILSPTYECVCDLGAFNADAISIMVKTLRKQQVSVNNIGTPGIGLMATEMLTYIETINVARLVYNPSTYGSGIYGKNTYFASVPSVPTTTYGGGVKYGNSSYGYA